MSLGEPLRRSRTAFTLVELLVVIAIVAVLSAILLPAVQASREAARRATCFNKLKQQATALANYHSQWGRFPEGARRHDDAGSDSIGWHVLVLPMLEQEALHDEINPQEDGGARFKAGNKIPDVFTCPSATPPTLDPYDVESANYVGVAGSGTSRVEWPLQEGTRGHAYTDGVLHLASEVAVVDITDGSSHTLLIGERTFFNTSEYWSFGASWRRDRKGQPKSITLGAVKHAVWPINTIENGRAFYIRQFSAPSEKRLILSNDLSFGSRHPGGAAFAMADGSVQFFAESLDLSIFRDLASRNGGETNRRTH